MDSTNVVIDSTKKNKNVNFSKVEPITNIQVIRDPEPSISSGSSSVSSSSSSESGNIPIKKKKIIKKLKNNFNFKD
jgi:hypothetical protein